MSVAQESIRKRRKPTRLIILGMIGLLFTGVVGSNLYNNLIYGRIDSHQPSLITDQPSFLYNLQGNSETLLKEPMGIAVSRQGFIFISDTGNARIQVYYPNGKFAWAFGNKNSSNKKESKLSYPYGLAVLDNGNLLVADSGIRQIQEYTPKGSFVRTLLPSDGSVRPGAAANGQDGKIYVSDLAGHQVLVLDGTGKIIEKIKGEFQYPQGLAVKKQGSFYLADSGNFRVELLDHKGKTLKVLTGVESGSGFTMVRGLALDNLNRLFVSDTMAQQVRVFDPEVKEIFKLKDSPAGGSLNNPTSLVIDNWGRVFIADRGNNRVQVWGYPLSKK